MPRKTYTYGGTSSKDISKEEWNKISNTESTGTKLPQKKGIWAKASNISPFKKSPLKKPTLKIKTNFDPFVFDDFDGEEIFNFKEDGIKTSPKKGKRGKVVSPKSPTGVNPRLFGRVLPDESVTINANDLKKKGKQTPKKSPSKSVNKDVLDNNTKKNKKETKKELKKENKSETPSKTSRTKRESPTKKVSPKKTSSSSKGVEKPSPKKTKGHDKGKKIDSKSPKKQINTKKTLPRKSSSPLKKKSISPKKAVKKTASPVKSVKKSVSPKKAVSSKKSVSPKKTAVNKKSVNSKKSLPKNSTSPKKAVGSKKVSPKKSPVKGVTKTTKTIAKSKTVTKSKNEKASPKKKVVSTKVKSPTNRKSPSPKKTATVKKSTVSMKNTSTIKTETNSRKRKTVSPTNVNKKKMQKIKSPPPKKKNDTTKTRKATLKRKPTSVEKVVPQAKRKRVNERNKEDEQSKDLVTPENYADDEMNEEEEGENVDHPLEENNDQSVNDDLYPTPRDSPRTDENYPNNEEEQDGENVAEDEKDVNKNGDVNEENEEDEESMVVVEENGDGSVAESEGSKEKPDVHKNNVSGDDDGDEECEGNEEEDESHGTKSKSLFSYYDKQKKQSKTDNIYKGSKGVIRFEQEDNDDGHDNNPQKNIEHQQETLVKQKSEELSKHEEKTETTTKDKTVNKNEEKKKLVKSPFKSLKPNVKSKRFSALPTDITLYNPNEEKEDKDEDDTEHEEKDGGSNTSFYTNIFEQSGSSSFKVRRDEKELFTVVRDTKHAYQCLEHGESQLFKDDLEYLLDGLKPSHNSSTRCLSALELASKCTSPDFRMHIKAHGLIEAIFVLLQDAHSDEILSLCTSVIIFILSKDRLKTGFDKKIIAFVLNLLMKTPSEKVNTKAYEKIHNKVKALFEKYNDPVLDLNNITASSLARETLLSLTSKKTGEWFKEEMRTLGGLDHVSDSIYSSSKCIQKQEELEKHYNQTERYFILLCDITFKSKKNQGYLASYRDGLLIESCVRILTTLTSKIDLVHDFPTSAQRCLFALLRFLTNMSHENEKGSVRICKEEDALKCFLRCVLYIPQFLPQNKSFDFIVVALGLLINLTEHSHQNLSILNTAFAPACCESEGSSSIDDEISPVEALTQLFLVRNEACKEGDLMEELEKLEKEQEEKDASMHFDDNQDALVCGDKFDDTVEESNIEKNNQEHCEENDSAKKDDIQLNQKEKQDIKNTLEKAHQHMEDSHVAAYSALLIGLLAENNKDNQDTIHSLLPDGDFNPMKESLEKILAFMKMTGATNEAGFKVIERIINVFHNCGQTYPKKVKAESNEASSEQIVPSDDTPSTSSYSTTKDSLSSQQSACTIEDQISATSTESSQQSTSSSQQSPIFPHACEEQSQVSEGESQIVDSTIDDTSTKSQEDTVTTKQAEDESSQTSMEEDTASQGSGITWPIVT